MSNGKPKTIPGSRTAGHVHESWWYEERYGVIVVVEMKGHDRPILSGSVRIPWGQLLRAAQRSSGKEVIVKEKVKTTKRKAK